MAPVVRTAVDVAELRNYLVRQWQPGGGFRRATEIAVNRALNEQQLDRGIRYRDEAETERVALQRSSLWYVEEPMVDLLCDVKESTPDDVTPEDLVWPENSGLVVFARPIGGTAIDRPLGVNAPYAAIDAPKEIHAHNTEVWAIMWNRSNLPPWNGSKRIPSLSVHSYRMLNFEDGLDPDELNMAQMLGELTPAKMALNAEKLIIEKTGEEFGNARDAAIAAKREGLGKDENVRLISKLTGCFWAPMGHSDWPMTDQLDYMPPWCREGVMWDSFKEDRQLVAALFTCLAEEGITSRMVDRPSRELRRRSQRQGITGASDVVVINLRKPRPVPHPDFVPAEPGTAKYSHRWLVREHMRWQPCGPGREQRRLTLIPAHIKGPADAPLVVKTKIHRWVR